MDVKERYVYVYVKDRYVFPALWCTFSRQAFFWRFGDAPFSRELFLDGGNSSSDSNFTVNITWTVAWLSYTQVNKRPLMDCYFPPNFQVSFL